MCFYAKLFSKKQIANEDIIVWKTGYQREDKDTFRTSTMYYTYRLNVPQPKIKLKKEICWVEFAEIGICITEGYHVYTYKPTSELCYDFEIMAKCIIPKDTAYYTNGDVSVAETITVIAIV
jgi:hypothetical protein